MGGNRPRVCEDGRPGRHKALKVLLVHSGEWECRTGVITHICSLGRALAGRGHSVRIIMRGRKEEFAEAGVYYVFSPDPLSFFLNVHRQARQCEVVHCHDVLSVLASLPKGNRVLVYTGHHVFADTRLFRSGQEWQGNMGLSLRTILKCGTGRILGRGVLKSVDRVMAVSAFTKDALEWIYHVPTSRIEVVFNGVEAERFARCDIALTENEDDVRRILSIKLDDPRKGLHQLLAALPLVLEKVPKAELTVAGPRPSGDYGRYIQNLVDKYRISAKVVLTGEISFDNLVSLYLSSHLVVVPSAYEGFGMVVLEAGACGRPVIASDIGGLNEAVVDGETGFLVEVRDPSLFAAAMVKVLSDDPLRRQLGENAHRRVLEKFTWHRISGEIEHIYEAALTRVYKRRQGENDTEGMARLR